MAERRCLYLIRHGQTVWNVEKRLQGGRDSPLTPLGRCQADIIARSLKPHPPSLIIGSPLGRARSTASIIGKALGIETSEDARLSELGFGSAEGSTLAEIDQRWPGFLEERRKDKWNRAWPDGENYRDADRRIESFVRDTLVLDQANEPGLPLAIVGHETINMILAGRLLQLQPDLVTELGQPNHVIYRITDGLIEHAHLGDDSLHWIPGMLKKRTDEIIHLAA